MLRIRTPLILISTVLLLLTGLPRAAAQPSRTEDFTTTTYRDDANTTADWDTVGAQLRLEPFTYSLVGTADTPSNARDVEVAGNLAFIADASTGLRVIDITDPANPFEVGFHDTPGIAFGVALDGDYAFVADAAGGLRIIDITNPALPTLVGAIATPDLAYDVAVAGDLAFVADALSGMRVIDISNPASPVEIGFIDTPSSAFGVDVDGDYAYIADWIGGVRIVDISDPTSPSDVGSVDTPGRAYEVIAAGEELYVADWDRGLQVIDIVNPAAPFISDFFNTSGNAEDLAISGNRAYVADGSSGIRVIDITDPANVASVATLDTPGNALGVVIAGENAFIADGVSGLRVVRIRASTRDPLPAGSFTTAGAAYGLAISGNIAYVAEYGGDLEILDIGDPATPSLIGGYATPGISRSVVVEGDYAFVADGDSGLHVIDVSNPGAPTFAARYDTTAEAWRVEVAGDLAFVSYADAGLIVFDISDPTAPLRIGDFSANSFGHVVPVGDIAVVAGVASGLIILDISDPSNPTQIGSYNTPAASYSVFVEGDLVYAADLTSLQIIDISDPTNPTFVGSYPGYPTQTVAVAGDIAVVSQDTTKMTVLDVSDPATPTPVGEFTSLDYNLWKVIDGEMLYLASNTQGVQVVRLFQTEVDDPGNDTGYSLAVDGADDTILKTRLTSDRTAGLAWSVSADGGASWEEDVPEGAWIEFGSTGSDLIWRSLHAWEPGLNPTATTLTVEWLNEFANVTSVADVPNDQGGRVYVECARSAYDFDGEMVSPIAGYNLYRRVDDPGLVAAVAERGVPAGEEAFVASLDGAGTPHNEAAAKPLDGAANATRTATFRPGGVDHVAYAGGVYASVPAGANATAGTFPPGTWVLVASSFATQTDLYTFDVPSAGDSTTAGQQWSVYMVTAHTTSPSVWFASHPDSGYSLDNIAPGVPQSFTVGYNTGGGNALSWDAAPEPDFQFYRVYRSSDPNFTPTPGDLVHETAMPGWNDPDYSGAPVVYYKVSAVDHAGNESDPAGAETLTGVRGDGPAVPGSFALHANVPNPFNPTTTIRYDVPAGGARVEIVVFDGAGRRVRALMNAAVPGGRHRVTWDGRNDRGALVATGVYFYRMSAGSFVETRKMVLVK